MAGIFNLFGEISEPDRVQVMKPLAKSKTTLGRLPAKSVGQSKPKGLSIRSNSDLNVPFSPRVSGTKQDASNNKQQEFLKPKLTQLDSGGHPISPMKDGSSKKLNVRPIKMKDLSPKKEVLDGKTMKSQKLSDDVIFKKPLPPKKFVKKPAFAEPENLAPYYDFQFEFDDIYSKTLENEFKELIMKKNEIIKPFEDEGFESDPEELICPKIPTLSTSPELFDEEWKKGWSPTLPYISDDDDSF